MMSRRQGGERLALLRRGLETASLLTLPAGVGLVAAAPGLVALLLPQQTAGSRRRRCWPGSPCHWCSAPGMPCWRVTPTPPAIRLPLRCELPRQRAERRAAGGPAVDFRTAGDSPRGPWRGCSAPRCCCRRQALLGALPWARLWLLNALAMAPPPACCSASTVSGCNWAWAPSPAAWRCSAWRSGCGPGAPIDPWLRVGSLALGPSNNHCELARQAGVAK